MSVDMSAGRSTHSPRKRRRVVQVMSISSIMRHSDITVLGTTFFFCLTYVLLGLTDGLLVSQGVPSSNILIRLKYPCMLATIACAALHMVLSESTFIFRKEFVQLLSVGIVFFLISSVEIILTDSIGTSTVDDLIKLILPAVMAYCVLNTLNFEQLQRCMTVVFLSSITGYVCELSFSDISVEDILQSSFSSSSSSLESSIFAGISITLCFYYCYYRSNKMLTVLAVAYAIATFKRMAIIFAIVAFVAPMIVDVNKKISRYFVYFLSMTTLVVTGVYYWLLLPSSELLFKGLFGQSQMDLSMGRSAFLAKLMRNGFVPFGYGSSADVIGRTIEMDLIQIVIELTPLALLVFVCVYWNICCRNMYCIIVMLYEFSNFITSHSLNSNYKWGICFILIGMISYMPRNNSDEIDGFKKWSRRLFRMSYT